MDFLSHLEAVLKQNRDFWAEDGTLIKAKVRDAANRLDPVLLDSLENTPSLAQHFFSSVGSHSIFHLEKFNWVLNSKAFLPDSFTRYRNIIGLSANDRALVGTGGEAVLIWPYKDCVLEGGQSGEDENRREVFYNETLAPDEVYNLLSPKAFEHVRKYTSNETHGVDKFDESDSLIIKGNNLQVLSSLRERYRGKVKFIYIDPPYNTGGDSFRYNDKFSRSSWLTFMRNRIEVAKDLLEPDGVFAIQISFHEGSYLDVMLDDIDGLYRVMAFHVLVRHPDRTLTSDKSFNDVMEMVLVYSKNPEFKMPKREKLKTAEDYQYEIEVLGQPETKTMGNKLVEVYSPEQWHYRKVQANADALKPISIRGTIREKNSSGRFYVSNIEPFKNDFAPLTLFKVPDMGDDGLGFRYFHTPKLGNKNGTYFQGMPQSSKITYSPYANFVDFVGEYNTVNSQGSVEFRNGKKPEQLIQFLLEMFTNEDDVVLDYHLGSGTTAATALKMNRRFIGVEQMDYIESVSLERLHNVLAGDETGISADVDWHGGGSFVYAELAQRGQKLLEEVLEANSEAVLDETKNKIIREGVLRPSVLPEELTNTNDEFDLLTFEEKKRILAEVIDKNRLYVDASAVRDDENGLDASSVSFTESFYRMEN